MTNYKKLSPEIFNAEADNLAKLATLFPTAVKDGQLDIAALREELGQFEEVGAEKYELTWAGKQAAKKLSQTDVAGQTLKYVPEDSKNPETTQNLYIEGDNLEVLKLLRQNYYGAVKMIYIDPPYNTGNDFVYRDNFTQSQAESDEAEGETVDGERMVVNQKSSNRYHANWLNMMYPRLRVAKDLLCDDGVIFISIDDTEIENLKKICSELFGESNFAGQFPWRKRTAKSDVPFGISQDYEWLLVYAKSTMFLACLEGGTRKYYETDDFPGRPWRIHDLTKQTSASERPNSFFTIVDPKTGNEYPANPNRTWAITEDTFPKYYAEKRIVFPDDYDFLSISKPALRYFKEADMEKAGDRFGFIPVSTNLPNDVGMTQDGTKDFDILFGKKIFGFPKPTAFIKYLVKMTTAISKDDRDIILDFFSGSATTAHAAMQLNAEDSGNRRFIMVQYPEVCAEGSEARKADYETLCGIGKERIRLAGEKIKAEVENANAQLKPGEEPKQIPDIGFRVFRVADTNIRWTHEALFGDEKRLYYMAGHTNKEKLDFMPGYTDIDVVYEILLRQRDIPLSAKLEKLDIGKRTYMFADAYVVCLDDSVSVKLVEELAAVEPTPIKYVFRDSAFDDNISLKDETIRRLQAYIARNSGERKKTYTVEFI